MEWYTQAKEVLDVVAPLSLSVAVIILAIWLGKVTKSVVELSADVTRLKLLADREGGLTPEQREETRKVLHNEIY